MSQPLKLGAYYSPLVFPRTTRNPAPTTLQLAQFRHFKPTHLALPGLLCGYDVKTGGGQVRFAQVRFAP